MVYCSPLWAGAPASHLSWLNAVETKAFRIIGISCSEAESLGLSLTSGRSVVFLSSTVSSLVSPPSPLCLIYPPSPPYFCRALKVRQQPPSGKTTKITDHCSPSLFHSFFPAFGINSLALFNPILPSRPSKQLFTTTSNHPPSKSSIFSTPDNPPKPTSFKFPAFLPESPCNVHLLFPMFPIPSLSLPQIS